MKKIHDLFFVVSSTSMHVALLKFLNLSLEHVIVLGKVVKNSHHAPMDGSRSLHCVVRNLLETATDDDETLLYPSQSVSKILNLRVHRLCSML